MEILVINMSFIVVILIVINNIIIILEGMFVLFLINIDVDILMFVDNS